MHFQRVKCLNMYWLSCGDLYYGFLIVAIIKVTVSHGYQLAIEPQRTLKWNGQHVSIPFIFQFIFVIV